MKRTQFLAGISALPVKGIVDPGTKGEIIRRPHCHFPGEEAAFRDFVPWEDFNEPFEGRHLPVFTYGNGHPIIVLHEILGAGPSLFTFAKRLADESFRVFVPILYGTPNRDLNLIDAAIRVCLRREFALFDTRKSSPIIQWVSRLGSSINSATGNDGIGVIGLCLTGNFALAMLKHDYRVIPVVSEPSLPFWNPAHPTETAYKASLGLSSDELTAIEGRLRKGTRIAAFRFQNDPFCPEERARTLSELCARGDSELAGNLYLVPPCKDAHAVFTDQFDNSTVARDTFQELAHFLAAEFSAH